MPVSEKGESTKNLWNRVQKLISSSTRYLDPSKSGSLDILFTTLFLYKMPVSEKGESTENLQNMFKS